MATAFEMLGVSPMGFNGVPATVNRLMRASAGLGSRECYTRLAARHSDQHMNEFRDPQRPGPRMVTFPFPRNLLGPSH
jgi:hypothetical protein